MVFLLVAAIAPFILSSCADKKEKEKMALVAQLQKEIDSLRVADSLVKAEFMAEKENLEKNCLLSGCIYLDKNNQGETGEIFSYTLNMNSDRLVTASFYDYYGQDYKPESKQVPLDYILKLQKASLTVCPEAAIVDDGKITTIGLFSANKEQTTVVKKLERLIGDWKKQNGKWKINIWNHNLSAD